MVLGLPTLAAMLVTLHVADAASSEVPADTVLGLRLPPPAQSTNQALGRSIPVLNWVPRADWLNVQTSCGAKGDGKTDDHAALQACIDRLTDTEYGCNMPGMCSNATKTLYFPPGTYAISQTLVISGLTKMYGGKVLGHGADTTILWTGPASPTAFEWDFRSNDPPPYPESSHSMWLDNGTSYFHYEGISWNGQGKASVGIDHYSHNHYGTFMLHRSESFHGFNISGIRVGGFNGFGEKMATAEVRYQNCHFASSRYGIMPQSYNDLDNLIEGCLFEDLEVGIQTMSHGNFYLRDSRFERSNSSDVVVSATSATIRRVVSINSTMLADSGCCSSAAPLRVEDCRVHQRRELPWNAKGRGILPAIGLSYRGPVQVIDTTFMPTFEHICAANESCVSNMPQRDPSVFKYMNNSITVCPTGSSSEFRNYSVSQWSRCQAECANTTGCMAWSIFPFSNKGYPGVQSVCAVGGFTAGWPKPLPPNFTQSLVPTRRPWSNGGGENSTAPSGCMRCGNGGVDKCAGGYQNSPFIDAFTSGWEQTVIVSNNKLDDKDLLGETGPKSGNEAIVVPQGSLGASQINFDTHFLHSEWPQLCTKIFDAKKDMGAVADGKNDDTAAVQKAIDAAAAASHGACAYLGPGSFKLTAQLTMAGSDFSLEGSGTATYLIAAWPKASNDSMIEIGATASNLSLAGFWARKYLVCTLCLCRSVAEISSAVAVIRGQRDFDNPTPLIFQPSVLCVTAADKPNFQPVIRVAPAESGAAPRFIEIDRVLSMDNWTGIVLQSLGASDTVKMGQIAMTLSVINSSSAVVLVSMNEGGYTLVAKTLQ